MALSWMPSKAVLRRWGRLDLYIAAVNLCTGTARCVLLGEESPESKMNNQHAVNLVCYALVLAVRAASYEVVPTFRHASEAVNTSGHKSTRRYIQGGFQDL